MKFSLKEFFVREAIGAPRQRKPLGLPTRTISGSPVTPKPEESFEQQFWDYAQNRYNVSAQRLNSVDPETLELAQGEGTSPEELADEMFGNQGRTRLEHQDPTVRKDVGSTAWSSPSQEVDVKHFFNHDGHLDIDLDEGLSGGDDYLRQVLSVFLDLDSEEYKGGVEEFEFSPEETETIEQCKQQGMSPKDCAKQMINKHRWQADRDGGGMADQSDWCDVCNTVGGNPECKYCRDHEKETDRAETYFGGMKEMGGPGSGRKKGSKNKPKGLPQITPGKPVDPSTLPDELPDEWIADEPKADEPAQELGPFARVPGDEDELSFLDDPNFGKDVEMPAYEPRKLKPKAPKDDADGEDGEFSSWLKGDREEREKEKASQFPPDENFDWDFSELRFEDPDVADDIETELGSEAMQGAKFTRSRGFYYMITADGERWKGSAAAGWLPFDDGKSPVGEF